MEQIRKEVYEVLHRLNSYGYEAYLVGGAVRSLLLNMPIADYDIATNARPETTSMIFSEYRQYQAGKRHGTVAVLISDLKIEITTFRSEKTYNDNRHPDQVEFVDELKEDVIRRDFTVNALAMDRNDNIIDHTGGIEDLRSGIIRAIGDPDRRFREDALRILRAIRFRSKLGFTIDAATEEALFKNSILLKNISEERKRDEFLQILSFSNKADILKRYREIFETFIKLKNDDSGRFYETADKLNDIYHILAWIIKDENELEALKLSRRDEQLVNALIDVRNRTEKGIDNISDYEFICVMSGPYEKEIASFLSCIYGPEVSRKTERLKDYFVYIPTLDISSKELMEHGYSGKAIRDKKEEIIDLIHHQKLSNKACEIRKML